jgi:hypothetical protein
MTVYGEIPIDDYLRLTGDVPKKFLPVAHVRKGYVFSCVECMRSWLDRDLPHHIRKSVLMQTDGTIVILAKPPVSDG